MERNRSRLTGTGVCHAERHMGKGTSFKLGDYCECPLELVSLLSQEDWVLLRDHHVSAGCVFFSFSHFHQHLGSSLADLHFHVPSYDKDLQGPVGRLFDRMAHKRPVWRTNWDLSWSPELCVNAERYPHRKSGLSGDERQRRIKGLRARVEENGIADSCFLKVGLADIQYSQTKRQTGTHART